MDVSDLLYSLLVVAVVGAFLAGLEVRARRHGASLLPSRKDGWALGFIIVLTAGSLVGVVLSLKAGWSGNLVSIIFYAAVTVVGASYLYARTGPVGTS